MTFTPEQLAVADEIDELEIGQTVEFADSDSIRAAYVRRESPTRFVVNDGAPCGFIEACHAIYIQ